MSLAAEQLKSETDGELMARFQAGDASALEEIISRYQKPLFNFFYRMVGRREVAEDLVQETFLKVYRFGSTFRGEDAKFSTWLYSVAGNQCRDYIRSSSRRPEISVEELEKEIAEDFESVLSSPSISPVEDHLIRMELQAALKLVINSLPAKERMAILLREYQGLEYKEIARALSCPMGSVKVLLFRARKRIRERLENFIIQ
jgi:RNA polymerase sigma-70 factor (ECF subfamily)